METQLRSQRALGGARRQQYRNEPGKLSLIPHSATEDHRLTIPKLSPLREDQQLVKEQATKIFATLGRIASQDITPDRQD